jgi:hypothetical protein
VHFNSFRILLSLVCTPILSVFCGIRDLLARRFPFTCGSAKSPDRAAGVGPMAEESRNDERIRPALSWTCVSVALVFSCFRDLRACSSLRFSKCRFADDEVSELCPDARLQRVAASPSLCNRGDTIEAGFPFENFLRIGMDSRKGPAGVRIPGGWGSHGKVFRATHAGAWRLNRAGDALRHPYPTGITRPSSRR